MHRRTLLTGLAATALIAPLALRARADTVFTEDGLAIGGYDPVAYFTKGEPRRGDAAFEADWNGATWRFASAENRDRFLSDPETLAPQYGGFCAYAVSENYLASIDPDAWTIHEGRLYLNYSRRVRRTWSRDIPGRVARGDANWPALSAQ